MTAKTGTGTQSREPLEPLELSAGRGMLWFTVTSKAVRFEGLSPTDKALRELGKRLAENTALWQGFTASVGRGAVKVALEIDVTLPDAEDRLPVGDAEAVIGGRLESLLRNAVTAPDRPHQASGEAEADDGAVRWSHRVRLSCSRARLVGAPLLRDDADLDRAPAAFIRVAPRESGAPELLERTVAGAPWAGDYLPHLSSGINEGWAAIPAEARVGLPPVQVGFGFTPDKPPAGKAGTLVGVELKELAKELFCEVATWRRPSTARVKLPFTDDHWYWVRATPERSAVALDGDSGTIPVVSNEPRITLQGAPDQSEGLRAPATASVTELLALCESDSATDRAAAAALLGHADCDHPAQMRSVYLRLQTLLFDSSPLVCAAAWEALNHRAESDSELAERMQNVRTVLLGQLGEIEGRVQELTHERIIPVSEAAKYLGKSRQRVNHLAYTGEFGQLDSESGEYRFSIRELVEQSLKPVRKGGRPRKNPE